MRHGFPSFLQFAHLTSSLSTSFNFTWITLFPPSVESPPLSLSSLVLLLNLLDGFRLACLTAAFPLAVVLEWAGAKSFWTLALELLAWSALPLPFAAAKGGLGADCSKTAGSLMGECGGRVGVGYLSNWSGGVTQLRGGRFWQYANIPWNKAS